MDMEQGDGLLKMPTGIPSLFDSFVQPGFKPKPGVSRLPEPDSSGRVKGTVRPVNDGNRSGPYPRRGGGGRRGRGRRIYPGLGSEEAKNDQGIGPLRGRGRFSKYTTDPVDTTPPAFQQSGFLNTVYQQSPNYQLSEYLEYDNSWPEFGDVPTTLEGKITRLVEMARKAEHKPVVADTIDGFLSKKGLDVGTITVTKQVNSDPGSVSYTVDLYIGGIFFGQGQDITKGSAKHQAYAEAMNVVMKKSAAEILKHHPRYDRSKGFMGEVNSTKGEDPRVETNMKVLSRMRHNMNSKDVSSFIILEHRDLGPDKGVNATSTLRQSSDFCHFRIEFHFDVFKCMELCQEMVRCKVYIEGQLMGVAADATRQEAKNAASEKTIDNLQKRCWTILIKQTGEYENKVNRALAREQSALEEVDSNQAEKMMRKWGWAGGALGKTEEQLLKRGDSDELDEPVTVFDIYGKQGLKARPKSGPNEMFQRKVEEHVTRFQNDKQVDCLLFSPTFNKDERLVIHAVAKARNLRAETRKIGGARHVFSVITRKMNAQELLKFLQENGNTRKYELLPPGTKRRVQSTRDKLLLDLQRSVHRVQQYKYEDTEEEVYWY